MARKDELIEVVGSVVSDPPSLVRYFTKVAELQQWVGGDEKKRGLLERRWRKRYADHAKKREAARKAGAA